MDIKTIIQGCKKNDRSSQRAFVDEYSKYLFAVCLRYMKDQEKAKDCLQDSLVHILQNIGKYRDSGTFKSWIARVTSNICLQELRRNKNKITFELEDANEPCVDESISKTLEVQDILKLINQLPEKYRIVVNLFIVEDYTHKEIADMLGVKESSSRSLVARARKQLNSMIQKEENKQSTTVSIIKKIKRFA